MEEIMPNTNTAVKTRTSEQVKEPSLFKVIYINDDATSMEFVVESLMSVFDYNQEKAQQLTIEVHSEGSAVVAVLPFELAEQKGLEVTTMARNQGFPLQVKLESE